MRASEIEFWALSIIDCVLSKQPIEDSRVEIKAIWPDPKEAARRIAAHANAARGESILWLIGLEERSGALTDPKKSEMATWFPAVQAQFNEYPPTVTDLVVSRNGKTVVALLFDTSRAPFVVKNPVFGTSQGGPVSLEVPWREGTTTRTATHSDLIRLLVPLEALPSIDVLSAELNAKEEKEGLRWSFEARLYFISRSDGVLVIPKHRYQLAFEIPGAVPMTDFEDTRLQAPRIVRFEGATNTSLTVDSTSTEVIVNRAGLVLLYAHVTLPLPMEQGNASAHVMGQFRSSHDDRAIVANISLPRCSTKEKCWGNWSMQVKYK